MGSMIGVILSYLSFWQKTVEMEDSLLSPVSIENLIFVPNGFKWAIHSF